MKKEPNQSNSLNKSIQTAQSKASLKQNKTKPLRQKKIKKTAISEEGDVKKITFLNNIPFISEEELTKACEEAKINFDPRQLESAAAALKYSFVNLMQQYEDNNLSNERQILKKKYNEINKQSNKLLALMGFQNGHEALKLTELKRAHTKTGRISNRPYFEEFSKIRILEHNPEFLLHVPFDLHYLFRGQKNTGLSYGESESSRFIEDTVTIAPFVVSVISELACTGASLIENRTKGKAKDHFTPKLLSDLANIYTKLTGSPPAGMRNTYGEYNEGSTPILWLRKILGLALRKFPEYCAEAPYREQVIADINRLLGFTDPSLIVMFKNKGTGKQK